MNDNIDLAWVAAAACLDGLLGDPLSWPHPVNGLACWARRAEKITRRLFASARLAGAATVASTLAVCGLATSLILLAAGRLHPAIEAIFFVYLVYAALACRGLVRHALAVKKELDKGDLPAARDQVANIVGRDTQTMNKQQIVRATLESVGENCVDGVTAPLLWAIFFGPLGVWLFKAASTMDSLFGYRDPTYREFGWAAARLDDWLVFPAARLSLPIMALAASLTEKRSFFKIFQLAREHRKNHDSPNAGHGEAALAAGLGIRLGGPVSYRGVSKIHPRIGAGPEAEQPVLIDRAVRLVVVTHVLTLLLASAVKIGSRRLLGF